MEKLTIKTVADFKRGVKVGVKMGGTYHREFAGRDEKGNPFFKDKPLVVREVSIVQSNSFALQTTKANGEIQDSWCGWPKASDSKINNNEITIFEQGTAILTYWIATN